MKSSLPSSNETGLEEAVAENVKDYRAVDTRTAAAMLGLSTSHLEKLRLYDPENSPPVIRIGRAVRYPVDGLRIWAEARMTGRPETSDTASGPSSRRAR